MAADIEVTIRLISDRLIMMKIKAATIRQIQRERMVHPWPAEDPPVEEEPLLMTILISIRT